MVRTEPTADASLAAIRERSRFGIAMAAMIRMIATTISSSISDKPFCLRIFVSPLFLLFVGLWSMVVGTSGQVLCTWHTIRNAWMRLFGSRAIIFAIFQLADDYLTGPSTVMAAD